MTDTTLIPAAGGAESHIVITSPDDITQRAIETETDRQKALDLDAPTDSQEPENPEIEKPSESSTEDDEPGDEPEKKGKPPKGVQKRLDELTREKHENARRAEAAEARLQQALELLERNQGAAEPRTPATPTVPMEGAPNPNQYPSGEFDPAYVRDLAKFEVRQEIRAAQAEIQHAQTVSDIASREDQARAKYADYNEVVSADTFKPLIESNWPLFQSLSAHEQGPDLAYYLGKNPAEVAALARMDPVSAGIRVGQLLTAIAPQGEPAIKPKPVSKAPPPIDPIRGSGAAPAVNYEQAMSEALEAGNFDRWQALKRARSSGK